MKQSKIRKYSDIADFPNVIEAAIKSGEKTGLTCVWDSSLFNKNRDITLELGCGWGEYTLDLAKRFPHRNFIGIDIKGARIWHGARKALDCGLSNVLFVRAWADRLADFFPLKSISEIWLTFPDPHIKKSSRNMKKRFSSNRFLSIYKKILKDNGVVHLKTDSEEFFHFTKIRVEENSGKIIHEITDIHSDISAPVELKEIRTRYEKRFISRLKPIRYLQFSL